MGIVNRFFVPELTNQPNRQHAVEVYTADDIGFPEKQVKEQPGIVFGIKAGTGFKKTIQPLLIIFFPAEWRGRGLLNPGKCNRIACIGQAGTDAYHALVVVEVVGNSKYYLFQIARFGMACPVLYAAKKGRALAPWTCQIPYLRPRDHPGNPLTQHTAFALAIFKKNP